MWQSHLSYHPRVGHTFTPNFRTRVAHSGGGYLLRTNSQGFRSEREFVAARPDGAFRILLFGDSQAAGLGVSNRQRFGDQLEVAIPGLEVFNYALPGIGTDQQYLLYAEFADVEHDLVIIAPYAEDAARVASRYLRFNDQNGEEVFYGKPYYEIADNELRLHHQPVPKRPLRRPELPPETVLSLRSGVGQWLRPTLLSAVHRLRLAPVLRQLSRQVGAQRRGGAADPGWRLITEILRGWVAASRAPVLMIPMPGRETLAHSSVPGSTYQERYRELARTLNCSFHDPAVDLAAMASAEQASLWFPHDPHLSQAGHSAIARSLAPVIRELVDAARIARTR